MCREENSKTNIYLANSERVFDRTHVEYFFCIHFYRVKNNACVETETSNYFQFVFETRAEQNRINLFRDNTYNQCKVKAEHERRDELFDFLCEWEKGKRERN